MFASSGGVRGAAWMLLLMGGLQAGYAVAEYVVIPPGKLASVLAGDADTGPAVIQAFAMRATPVTNGEYLTFIKTHQRSSTAPCPAAIRDAI